MARRVQRLFLAGVCTLALVCGVRSSAGADTQPIFTKQPRGPSFDCSLTTLTAVERRICKSALLSRLDLELNDAYAHDASESEAMLAVADREAAWLRARNACTNDACLAAQYRRRMAELDLDQKLNDRDELSERWEQSPPMSPRLARTLAAAAGVHCFHIHSMVDLGDGLRSYIAESCDEIPRNRWGPDRLGVDRFGAQFRDHMLVLHPQRGRFHVVLNVESANVAGLCCRAQIERSHGLRRLAVFTASGAGDSYSDLYDYDGHVYRMIATVEVDSWNVNGHERLTISHK
jgi:uncharacterized protein